MSWKAGRVFTKKYPSGQRVRGRYYYWKGRKRGKVFRDMRKGKPTWTLPSTRRR